MILKQADGYLVRLGDIGRAELGAVDERRINRFNGRVSITVGVVKQSTANPLEISEGIKKELPRVLRSEEHTSELQSLMRISYAVFCLKKKKTTHTQTHTNRQQEQN